jgi:hypothetical protein
MTGNSLPAKQSTFAHPDDLHEWFKDDANLWRGCQFVGIQPGLPNEYFEMRQCPICQTSMAKRCSLSRAKEILAEQQALVSHSEELLR